MGREPILARRRSEPGRDQQDGALDVEEDLNQLQGRLLGRRVVCAQVRAGSRVQRVQSIYGRQGGGHSQNGEVDVRFREIDLSKNNKKTKKTRLSRHVNVFLFFSFCVPP